VGSRWARKVNANTGNAKSNAAAMIVTYNDVVSESTGQTAKAILNFTNHECVKVC